MHHIFLEGLASLLEILEKAIACSGRRKQTDLAFWGNQLCLLDSLFQRFLRLRLSADWLREVNDMRQWMTRTE